MSANAGPPLAKVLLFNDDETTMEFVVRILEGVFGKTRDQAYKLVVEIHQNGSGECGVYTAQEAATIVAQVAALAQRNGYPLRCVAERQDQQSL